MGWTSESTFLVRSQRPYFSRTLCLRRLPPAVTKTSVGHEVLASVWVSGTPGQSCSRLELLLFILTQNIVQVVFLTYCPKTECTTPLLSFYLLISYFHRFFLKQLNSSGVICMTWVLLLTMPGSTPQQFQVSPPVACLEGDFYVSYKGRA